MKRFIRLPPYHPFFLASALILPVAARAAVSVTAASGGGAISADTAATAAAPSWTSLGSIVIAEPGNGKGDIGGGTFILKAPAGFEFNTSSTPSISFAGADIAAANIAVTDSSTLTITLSVSGSSAKDTITIDGPTPLQVRPTAGTPLASGSIYRPSTGGGTAVISGVTATANPSGSGGTSFGLLDAMAGAAKQLAFQTAPPSTATAGTALAPPPVVLVQDQFGNTRNAANGAADNTTVVRASRGVGAGALQGTTNVTCANGAATFASLWHNKAETITINFSSGSLTNVVSGSILVGPAPLTVSANNLSRSYGVTNPPLTVSYTGFIPGETLATSGVTGSPALTTTAQTTSAPGPYTIDASPGTLAAQNYTFVLVDGTLTVTKAPLTVRANDVVRLYGQPNPALTLTYTEFVLGQDSNVLSGSASVTTTAGVSSPVGSYPIAVTAGTLASANYAFTFVNGTLNVVPPNTLFVDNFTRSTDPGPLSPWVAHAGNWTVTGGLLLSGTNASSTYSQAYVTNIWTDSAVQAQIKFSAGAFGGGLGNRLNPATGARYAAWIYPAGSPGGSNVLRLLKFQNWTAFTVMQQASLPSVGTNWHTLDLVARGNRLAAHYDGALAASVTDSDPQPFLSGGIDLEMWNDVIPYTMSADDVLVLSPSGVAASNDTYTVRQAGTLTVSAPGVLANDATEMGGLTALLNTGPAHGTLNLSTNGGFTYLPVTSYLGADSFTYRASDGSSTSSVATANITVTANHAPVAANNSYSLMANTTLTVAAPGILANDSDSDGDPLTAVLGAGPTKGTLNLSPDGSFTYVPSANYTGGDSFTYRASDGLSNSSLATVSITMSAFTPWFTDAFNRSSLSPWVVQDGNWSVTAGVLKGGTNEAGSYGHAYLTNVWSDYSAQARVQLSTNGFGGGLSGRLNPATGARYAAWIYPEGSPAGSSVLKLLKFQDWTQFTVLQQVNLTRVGTNWHTLKIALRGNRIAVHYDGVAMLSVIDPNAQPLLSGGVSVDLWTATTPWSISADDVTVSAIPNVLATNDSYAVPMSGTLTVPSPGVLGNDFGEMGSLSPLLAAGPAHGTLILNANGSFTYAPNIGYAGADSFTYRATDGVSTSGLTTVSLTVTSPGPLFTDDFTHTGTLSPWVLRAGNWAVTTGTLQGGLDSGYTYGYVYLTNSWSDYEAQADIRFPIGAYGGGLAGRVNLATGTRYGLWIYPEGSAGGSSMWKLLKFQNWESYTIMQQGSVPGVGTNWHTLKLSLQGSNIKLYYDGSLLISTMDPQPYVSGALSLEHWTDATAYAMSADNVQVTALAPDLSVTAVGIAFNPSNQTVTVTFRGAPGALYQVQAATDIVPAPSWATVSTNLAGVDGRWTFTESLANNPSRCYRVIRQ